MILNILLLLLFIPSSLWAAFPPGIVPIASDEKGVTLEITLPDLDIETLSPQNCQIVHLNGWASTQETGSPQLPVAAVLMQVPPTGNVQVQMIEETHDQHFPFHPCPVPQQMLTDEGNIYTQWIETTGYQGHQFYPLVSLELDKPEILRSVSVRRLKILPFQWSPLTQVLHFSKRMKVSIQFEHPLDLSKIRSSERKGPYSAILQTTLINVHQQFDAQSIPIESRPPLRENLNIDLSDFRQKNSTIQRKKLPGEKLKFETTAQGLYTLRYNTLAKLGYPALNAKNLHLSSRGEEVAIHLVTAQEDNFASNQDYLEFYAPAEPHIYWLQWKSQTPGQRITEVLGKPTGRGQKISTFNEHLQIEQDKEKWLDTPGAPEQDYFFWKRLNAGETFEQVFKVSNPALETTEQAVMRITFQGRSTAPPHPDHHTLIKLNGTLISDVRWDGEISYVQEASFASSLLHEGENTVTIDMPGDTGAIVDVVYLNHFSLTYPRRLEAVEDSLFFTLQTSGTVHPIIRYFTQPDLVLYEVTHPDHPLRILDFTVIENEGSYQVEFEDELSTPKTYYLTTRKKIKNISKLTAWQPTKLSSPKNAADYILITPQAFLPAVEPLLVLRRQQGLRVKAVSVEDIYNEFNEGWISAQAIKNFLTTAYQTWQTPAPTYVFLVGSASQTEKNSQVPTYLSASVDGLTPNDNWFVSIEGQDVLPEMLIGRIPGKDLETVTRLIEKIVNFEKSTQLSPHKVLLVSDLDENHQFAQLNDNLTHFLPAEWMIDKIYLDNYFESSKDNQQTVQRITEEIVSSINSGILLSNYTGHGSVKQWSAKDILNPDIVQALTNTDQLIFAMMLTCINGYFIAGAPSLAEGFLLAQGGAIGSFASSNLSYQWENQILSEEIFSILFEQRERRLGPLTTQAKINAYGKGMSEEAVQMYTLFGDPAMALKVW